MSTNAFSLITQVTQVASIFKETSWEEMDMEARGYALGTVGKTASALFTDLMGFKPKKEKHSKNKHVLKAERDPKAYQQAHIESLMK